MRKLFIALTFLLVPACLSAQLGGKIYLQRADSLLQRVLSLYEVKKYGLLMETYPRNPKQQITYTANTGSEVNSTRSILLMALFGNGVRLRIAL